MKNSTIKTINVNLNKSLQKSQEATAILRACVTLAVNEDSKLTYTSLCENIPTFSKFSAKTLKNCIRFAKSIAKNTKKLGIKALIEFYKKEETRKAYDVLVNPNRKKASSTPTSSTPASTTPASKVNLALSNHFSESNKHKRKNDIELFVDSLSLEELKQAYQFIRNKLGLKTSEKTAKLIRDIKKIAC